MIILTFSQPGHKYLFSTGLESLSWEGCRLECEVYGGWLVQIDDLREYNCLMRHGLREEDDAWYWTDGNDLANSGVWTHALDNTEVSFFPPRVQCECEDSPTSCSGDALILNIKSDKEFRGNYCDYPSYKESHYICEGV